MKYGLLSYNTENIGDDIQSIAAEQFIPQVDLLVNRDNMSKTKEECVLILNGWFMHPINREVRESRQTFDFPPRDNIKPIITSFHLSKDSIFNYGYFKRHEPIGCRDLYTYNFLKDKGINAYFSGCLTLTLKRPEVERTNEVFCVDVGHEYVGTHLTHIINKDTTPEDRKKIALDLLNKYARAKKVITSRLHCYLPCRAFGTPVEFIGEDSKRFQGLISISDEQIQQIRKEFVKELRDKLEIDSKTI